MPPLTSTQAIRQFIERYGIPADQRLQAAMDLGTICVQFSMELQSSSR